MNEINKDLTPIKDESSNEIKSKVNINEESLESRQCRLKLENMLEESSQSLLEWDSHFFLKKRGFPHPHPPKIYF